ncbi:MAG: flotillin-like protein FloA [Fibrobacterota bacterium]
MQEISLILPIIGGILLLIFVFITWAYLGLWFQALVSGVNVGLLEIIFMRFRKVPPKLIVEAMITGKKAGLELETALLEAHFLSGGNVLRVVQALVAAQKADIDLAFSKCSAIDLAGRNVLEAVQMSVNPKVIETPLVAAVAKDGIQVKALSRVTVRANIERLVGGAGEETILARVGEGIVTTIGSAETHKRVLENPDMISRTVLDKGLDSGTAFEILSIDIADVDVGKNIGAELETDRASADKKIAQAKAEKRRAMAKAEEQEMIARVQEMRAKVVEAEAQVPLAMAEAFRSGNLGVMDYYKMKNVEADTSMRDTIAKDGKNDDEDNSDTTDEITGQ